MKWLDTFRLSETEKKGFYTLAVVMFLLILGRVVFILLPDNQEDFQSTLLEDIEKWEKEKRAAMLVPHAFDPNMVSEEFVQTFILSDFVKENWLKFLARNNRFNEPEDVLSLYGMDTLWYEVNKDSIFIQPFEPINSNVVSVELFEFDPNTASKSEFLKLGIPDWLAQRILNFREKGGVFSTAEDLAKIYDFPAELYERLLPFIKIEQANEVSIEEPDIVMVEINSADSLALIKVKGIGPTFANRILKHRKSLRGFSSLIQLKEIYGIDDENFIQISSQLSVNPELIIPLKINIEDFKVLLSHPYLNYNQVKAIVGYREQIGRLKAIEDLINLSGFSDQDLKRLRPYLSVE